METRNKSWKQRVSEYDGIQIDWNSKRIRFALFAVVVLMFAAVVATSVYAMKHPDPSSNKDKQEYCSEKMGSRC